MATPCQLESVFVYNPTFDRSEQTVRTAPALAAIDAGPGAVPAPWGAAAEGRVRGPQEHLKLLFFSPPDVPLDTKMKAVGQCHPDTAADPLPPLRRALNAPPPRPD